MSKIWRIIDIVNWAEKYFSQNQFINPKLEIEWLLRSLLKCNKLDIYLRFEEPLDKKQLSVLKGWIKRRVKTNEPLQYITGSCEFYGRRYSVNSKVLIPRQETERLVDIVIDKSKFVKTPDIIDVGTGSGCIASTLALEISKANVFGIDISLDAIQIAEKNKYRLNVKNVFFYEMNILIDIPFKTYDFLISNPPYVSQNEMKTLPNEIKNFEPHLALTDFDDGLIFYHRLGEIGKGMLKLNGWIILEVGRREHSIKVYSIFKNLDYRNLELIKDFNGDNRVLIAQA
ncbi:MAG: protein-(glutamine-N5) methyltransferase, release factor-specific [bacterium TMED264]|nr:MAG: protein-(glutamine-N5) methyltransferase, release factor-specific [bacterium TMED264]|tara:strand:+ start:166 stop:1023 length:858 start_codon:yes stop_codon:yes gene_type:complete